MGQENLASGFEARNVEPVTSRFTNWAVPAAQLPCEVRDFLIDLAAIIFYKDSPHWFIPIKTKIYQMIDVPRTIYALK